MVKPPTPPSPVEIIPSHQGDTSAIGSAHAPFLYFDEAPAFGEIQNLIQVTLTANRIIPLKGGQIGLDRVITAHLRMNIAGALSLKSAIDGALLLATPATTEDQNPTGKPKPN